MGYEKDHYTLRKYLAKHCWQFGTWFRSCRGNVNFSPRWPVQYESSPCTSCGHALWSDCSTEALWVWCFHWCPEDSAATRLALRNTCAEGREEQWVREWKKLGNGKRSLLLASNICITCERSEKKGIYLSSCELKSFRTLIFYLLLSWFCCSSLLARIALLYSQIPTGKQKNVIPPPYTVGFQFKGLKRRFSGNVVVLDWPVIQKLTFWCERKKKKAFSNKIINRN